MRVMENLTGRVYNNYLVLSLNSVDKGGNSIWNCLCNLCNTMSVVRRGTLRKGSKSCINCKMKHRTFPLKETKCNECGHKILIPNNRYTASCSEKCRKAYFSRYESDRRASSVESTLEALAVQIKSRAKRNGKEYNLSKEFLLDLLSKQSGLCAQTGRTLEPSSFVEGSKYRAHKNTVSVDRVDSSKGYTKDNVQLVVYHYNLAKSAFTQEEMMELCKDVLTKGEQGNLSKEGRGP